MTAVPGRPGWRDGLALGGFAAACFAVAAVGGAITATSVGTWYQGLAKPSFNPPDWLFAPVWTALYAMMAFAAWRAWRHGRGGRRRAALVLFFVQLALNLGWTVLFFGLREPAAALAEIAVLWLAIAATIAAFRRIDAAAAWLLAPYIAWVSFAAVLNAAIVILN
ncbi:MAG: TspO/MBR family protein [Rhodospirillales bacterium]